MPLIHLDTITSNQICEEPYNYNFQLNNPIRNCTVISLKGLEMPIGFNNIRSVSKLNSLQVQFSNLNIYTISVPEANYQDITSLITALNTAITSILPSNLTLVCSLNVNNTIRFTMNDTNNQVQSFQILQTNFACYILGFKNVNVSSVNKQLNSTLIYNLSVDNYIIMRLANVSSNTCHLTNISISEIGFKIPLNATNGMVYFLSNEANGFKQSISINKDDIYHNLTIRMYDRFGSQLLSAFNFDYSVTLEAQ